MANITKSRMGSAPSDTGAVAGFPELLSIPDLEGMTGIPQSTWRWMRHNGTGPKSIKIGRRVYVDKADALDWLNSHREEDAA